MNGGNFISFLDTPAVSSVVFYPRKIPEPKNLPENIKILKFPVSDDVTIGGFCYIQDKNLPTILMFHGNGEIAWDYSNFYELYFECGINLAVMDFRGYGFSTGNPFYTSMITDAMPIYDNFMIWLLEEGFKNSLFVLGRSLGSVCASEIGGKNPPNLRGIIFESGFASIYNMMTRLFRVSGSEITPENLARWSNDTRIASIRVPTLILHGTNDWIVPISEGELINETLPEDIEVKMIAIRGFGHNDILMSGERYFLPLKEFIQKYG